MSRKPWYPSEKPRRAPMPRTRAERAEARRRKRHARRVVALKVALAVVLLALAFLLAWGVSVRDERLMLGYEERVESGEWEQIVRENAEAILAGDE